MSTSSALTNIKEYSETRIVFLGTACHVFTDNFVSQKRELEEKEHTSLNLYMNYDDMLYIVGMNSTTEDHYIYIMSTTRSFAAKFCHFAQRDGVERIQYCVGVVHGVGKGFQPVFVRQADALAPWTSTVFYQT